MVPTPALEDLLAKEDATVQQGDDDDTDHAQQDTAADDEKVDSPTDEVQEIRQLFSELDSHGQGSLDKSEVREFLVKLGVKVDATSVVEHVMSAMDPDRDGRVTLQELLDWWQTSGAEFKEQMQQLHNQRMNRNKARRAAHKAAKRSSAAKRKVAKAARHVTRRTKDYGAFVLNIRTGTDAEEARDWFVDLHCFYKEERWWWFVLLMLRKNITNMIYLRGHNSDDLFDWRMALILSFAAFICLEISAQPYKAELDNLMDVTVMVILIVVLHIGSAASAFSGSAESYGFVFITVILVFTLFLLKITLASKKNNRRSLETLRVQHLRAKAHWSKGETVLQSVYARRAASHSGHGSVVPAVHLMRRVADRVSASTVHSQLLSEHLGQSEIEGDGQRTPRNGNSPHTLRMRTLTRIAKSAASKEQAKATFLSSDQSARPKLPSWEPESEPEPEPEATTPWLGPLPPPPVPQVPESEPYRLRVPESEPPSLTNEEVARLQRELDAIRRQDPAEFDTAQP
eukprot:COSAG02_NODE_11410_length_1729_cov_1.950920_1_plen_514_part_00